MNLIIAKTVNMSDLFIEAKRLFDLNELEDSLEIVNKIIANNVENSEVLLLRGRIYYKMQNWGDAINDFYSVLEYDPENQEAKSKIEMANSILGYFTPDMFNP